MDQKKSNGLFSRRTPEHTCEGRAIRTLTSPTAVTIHSVFDSEDRRIAEYNETSAP